jgi:hypothetical protein
MAGKAQHAASMVPSTFVEGGLWDDLDVEISDIAWTKFNFAKSDAAVNLRLALGCEFYPLEGLEAGKEPYQQMFSAGDLKYFVPSADDEGAYAVPVGDKSAMNSNTNASMFIISLFECATPEQHAWLSQELASGNCKALKGLKLHIKRQPQKERKGLSQQEGVDRTPTVMLATNIIALPGETESVVVEQQGATPQAASPKAASPKAAPAKPAVAPVSRLAAGGKANGAASQPVSRPASPAKPAAPSAANSAASSEWSQANMEAKAAESLLEILNANEGIVEFAEVPKQGFRSEALKACPPKVRQQVCAIMYNEQWIAAQEGVAYDPATSTVALA